MRPILHGTALCPLFRFPTGARLRLKVTMDADFDLDDREIVFAARSRYAVAGARPLYRISLADSPEVWTHTSPNTVELSLAPDADDETEDSERTLADMQAGGPMMWRMDFLDAEGEWPAMRLQGDIEWIQEEGDWDDDPRSTAAIPNLNVSIVAGVATVTVALISDGATVDNASVVAAIEEDPAAVKDALDLDTYTDEVEAASVVVSPGDTDRFGWIQTVLNVPTLRKITGAGLQAWLKSYFDGIYAAAASYLTSITTSTPTNLTGLLKGNGADVDVAVAGTDYVVPNLLSTPLSLPGLVLWLDASDASTLYDAVSGGSLVAADGTVARWNDKSGQNNHATQATSGARPVRKLAIQNGLDVLRFDATDDGFATPLNLTATAAEFSCVAVWAYGGAASSIARVLNGGQNVLLGHYQEKYDFFCGSSFMTNAPDVIDNQFVCQAGVLFRTASGQGRSVAFMGAVEFGSFGGASVAPDIVYIGAGASGVSFATPLAGDLAELLVFNRALNDTDISRLAAFLTSKWELTPIL